MYYYCSNDVESSIYGNNISMVDDIISDDSAISLQLLEKRYSIIVRDRIITDPVIVRDVNNTYVRYKNEAEKLIDSKNNALSQLKNYTYNYIIEKMPIEKQNKVIFLSKFDSNFDSVFKFFSMTQDLYKTIKEKINACSNEMQIKILMEKIEIEFVVCEDYWNKEVKNFI